MKKLKIIFVIGISIFFAGYTTLSSAQTSSDVQEWQQLGVHVVDYTPDFDVVPVTYKEGAFTSIKIRVKDGTVNMHRCMITFDSGEKQEIEINHDFTAGSEKIVELKGNKRIIDKVTFWYDTKNKSRQKAVVEVWGKK